MWRKITALTLVFILMWGNTGFSVNFHYCSSEQALYFSFYDALGNACNKEVSSTDDSSCGKSSKASCCELMAAKLPTPAKDDCCSDKKIVLKINDTYQQASRLEVPSAPWMGYVYSFFFFDVPAFSEILSDVFGSDCLRGVPISCSKLFVFISVFRI